MQNSGAPLWQYKSIGCNIAGKTYTESNNGDNLNLKINDVITIWLESNITTGFKWNISNETDSGIVSFVSSDYEHTSTDKELDFNQLS